MTSRSGALQRPLDIPADVVAGNRTSTDRLKLNIAYPHLAITQEEGISMKETPFGAMKHVERILCRGEYEGSLSSLGCRASQYC